MVFEVCKYVTTEAENEDGSTFTVNEMTTVMYEWNVKSMGIKELNLDYSGFDGVVFKTVWNRHGIIFTGMEQSPEEFQLYKGI